MSTKIASAFGKINPKNLFKKSPREKDDTKKLPKELRPKRKLFKYKRMNRSLGGDIVFFLFLFVASVLFAFPLVFAFSNSLKKMNELFLFPPTLIVKDPTFKNYTDLFNIMANSLVPMSKYIFNTVVITFFGTLFRVLSCSMCAYPLSKRQFKGRNFIFSLSTYALMFTPTAATISNYIIMANLGMIDTFWAILIPALGSSFALYLIKGFIDGFPDSVLEAARIDGAGEFKIFWSILMPSIKPGWLTLIVFSVQEYWNTGSNIYIYKEELKTLAYALSQVAAAGIARQGVAMAISIVMLLVPVIVFVISQSNILETMATSGMKD